MQADLIFALVGIIIASFSLYFFYGAYKNPDSIFERSNASALTDAFGRDGARGCYVAFGLFILALGGILVLQALT